MYLFSDKRVEMILKIISEGGCCPSEYDLPQLDCVYNTCDNCWREALLKEFKEVTNHETD